MLVSHKGFLVSGSFCLFIYSLGNILNEVSAFPVRIKVTNMTWATTKSVVIVFFILTYAAGPHTRQTIMRSLLSLRAAFKDRFKRKSLNI